MRKSRLSGAASASIFCLIAMSSHAALVDVGDYFGRTLYYDTVLDITWAIPITVPKTWQNASADAAALVIGDATDWRLPYTHVPDGAGPTTTAPCVSCVDNELGYMFAVNLGGTLPSTEFPDLESTSYWSATQYDADKAWAVHSLTGISDWSFKAATSGRHGWAVHEGNIGVIPVPAAVWLFGSGLVGLIGVARRKKAT